MINHSDFLGEGIAAYLQGKIEHAQTLLERAVQERPHRALAAYNLGIFYLAIKFESLALPFLKRATLLQPEQMQFCEALLIIYLRAARWKDAEQLLMLFKQDKIFINWHSWLQVCKYNHHAHNFTLPSLQVIHPINEAPDRALTMLTMSSIHTSLQQPFQQALYNYQNKKNNNLIKDLADLIAKYSTWGEGQHLYGLGLLANGLINPALAALERASSILPGRAEIWDHLGVALTGSGEIQRARQVYEYALALHPGRAETWNNAAHMAITAQNWEEALQYAWKAVQLQPSLTVANEQLLHSAHQLQIKYFHTPSEHIKAQVKFALKIINPQALSPEHLVRCADQFAKLKQHDIAIDLLERSLSQHGIEPSYMLGQLLFQQRQICDWRQWQERVELLLKLIRDNNQSDNKKYIITPFSALALPGLTSADLQIITRIHTEYYATWHGPVLTASSRSKKSADSRLKIGYLSADFQEHATAYLTAGVFEHHDRSCFELFAYSTGSDDQGPTRRCLCQVFENFIDLNLLNDLAAAERINADQLDLLIDLKGYTTNNRVNILAARPCSLQISWLAFPGTLGAPWIDYLIVDPIVVPPEQARFYDEKLAYLPHTYAPVDAAREVASTASRANENLPEYGFVFCCFNDPYKITPKYFNCWCELLKSVPDAVLWLYGKQAEMRKNLTQIALQQGVNPERLVFARHKKQPEHLARIALADLILDTLPYNAHTTASDALWMGVPVLTCQGETFPGKVAASLLTAAGLPELITTRFEDYKNRALWLATHRSDLLELRQRLCKLRKHAAFFDTVRFTHELEDLYKLIWERHNRGLPPSHLNLNI